MDIFDSELVTIPSQSLDARSVLGGLIMQYDCVSEQLAGLPGYDQVLVQLAIRINALEAHLGIGEEIVA